MIQQQDIFKDYPNPRRVPKIKAFLVNLLMKTSQPTAHKRPSIEKIITALEYLKTKVERDFAKETKDASPKEEAPNAKPT